MKTKKRIGMLMICSSCGLALAGLAMFTTSAQAGLPPPEMVEAGPNQTVNADDLVELVGSAKCPSGDGMCVLYYEWTQLSGTPVTLFDESGSVTGSDTAATNFDAATFTAPTTPGDLTFELVVSLLSNLDPLNDPTDQVTITVAAAPTPEEAIDALAQQVQDLVDADILNGGQGNALTSKLDGALDKLLAGGKTQSAINKLQAFVNQVQSLINDEILFPEEGQALIQAAMGIIQQLDV